jgi:hypothetical protein
VGDVDRVDFDLYEEAKCAFTGKFRAYADVRL